MMMGIDSWLGHKNQRTIAKVGSFVGAGLILNQIHNFVGFGITSTLGPIKFGWIAAAALILTGIWFQRKRF